MCIRDSRNSPSPTAKTSDGGGALSRSHGSCEPAVAVTAATEATVAVGDGCVPPLTERVMSAAAVGAAA
eukprot:5323466-Prymnesium_polylepis.1